MAPLWSSDQLEIAHLQQRRGGGGRRRAAGSRRHRAELTATSIAPVPVGRLRYARFIVASRRAGTPDTR